MLGLKKSDIHSFLAYIADVCVPFEPYFLFRPHLKDEEDNFIVELAIVSNCDFLISNNIKDFTTKAELKFDGLKVITPADFVKMWRKTYEN